MPKWVPWAVVGAILLVVGGGLVASLTYVFGPGSEPTPQAEASPGLDFGDPGDGTEDTVLPCELPNCVTVPATAAALTAVNPSKEEWQSAGLVSHDITCEPGRTIHLSATGEVTLPNGTVVGPLGTGDPHTHGIAPARDHGGALAAALIGGIDTYSEEFWQFVFADDNGTARASLTCDGQLGGRLWLAINQADASANTGGFRVEVTTSGGAQAEPPASGTDTHGTDSDTGHTGGGDGTSPEVPGDCAGPEGTNTCVPLPTEGGLIAPD